MAKRRKQLGKGYGRRMDDHKREQMKQQTRGKGKELEQLRDKLAAAGDELVRAQQEAAAATERADWYFEQWISEGSKLRRIIRDAVKDIRNARIVWFAYGMGAALVAVGAVLMWRGWM